MDIMENRYWPFELRPLGQLSEQGRRQVSFLEAAYQAGYKPYTFGGENFGASTEQRAGEIIFRGSQGTHWEVLLAAGQLRTLSAHVNGFGCAAEAVLRWLRRADSSEVLEYLKGQLFASPGCHLEASTEQRAGEIAGRSARGRHWELALSGKEAPTVSAHLNDLSFAVEALLRWLRGESATEIAGAFRDHLVRTPGCPEGFVIHEPEPIEERKPA